MKKKYCARLAYNGRGFSGFQRQENAPSVQQALEEVLSTVLGEPIAVVGCGRTDAGVHARVFYCHFESFFEVPSSRIHNINSLLGDRIAIYEIFQAKPDFHARFDAVKRSYEYHIHTKKDPFIRDWSFLLKLGQIDLDTSLLHRAAEILSKYSDFRSFCKTGTDVKTTLCKIKRSEWEIQGHRMTYHISADRFLRGMVRLIVGAMLNVARGKLALDEYEFSIESRSRLPLDWSVPAHGLYLNEVVYPES